MGDLEAGKKRRKELKGKDRVPDLTVREKRGLKRGKDTVKRRAETIG